MRVTTIATYIVEDELGWREIAVLANDHREIDVVAYDRNGGEVPVNSDWFDELAKLTWTA